jgi:sulfhydrogenase subunit beta (sulfur reductase)
MSQKWAKFPTRLHLDGKDLPALMGVSYKSPLWEEIGKRCFGCGSCNIVCPTCYCFDVQDGDSLDGKAGERYRVWDSCQLDAFARIGSGENFRKTRAHRLRHRFMRKGKYIAEAFPGHQGCVGCGRCARACLVDITPMACGTLCTRITHRRLQMSIPAIESIYVPTLAWISRSRTDDGDGKSLSPSNCRVVNRWGTSPGNSSR